MTTLLDHASRYKHVCYSNMTQLVVLLNLHKKYDPVDKLKLYAYSVSRLYGQKKQSSHPVSVTPPGRKNLQ